MKNQKLQGKARFESVLSEHGYKSIDPYVKNDVKIKIQCNKNPDHVVSRRPADFMRQPSCPICTGTSPIGAEIKFKQKILDLNFKSLEPYCGDKTKIKVECSVGHIFDVRPGGLTGCAICSGVSPIAAKARLLESVKNRTGWKLLGEYVNVKEHIEFECPKGHQCFITSANFNAGFGCGECNGNSFAASKRRFESEIKRRNYVITGNYIGGSHKIELICENNHEYFVEPYSFLRGFGCNKCQLDLVTSGKKFLNPSKYTWRDVLNKAAQYKMVLRHPVGCLDSSMYFANREDYWKFTCRCGTDFSLKLSSLIAGATTSCGCIRSQAEIDLFNFISKIAPNEKCLPRKRPLKRINQLPLEVDVYLPNKKTGDSDTSLGFEYCGMYWHGEKRNGKKAYNKHKEKYDLATKMNMRLVTIFESDWIFRKKQTKGYIRAILGANFFNVFARKCVFDKKELDPSVAAKFLDKHHIQGAGAARSQRSWGLFHKDRLVSVMTMQKVGNSWNMHRYCNRIGVTITGGFAKMLKGFRRLHSEEIFTYSDNRWSVGTTYKRNLFVKSHEVEQSYSYFKAGQPGPLQHKSGYMKSKIAVKFPGSDLTKTEWELMLENKYDRIWDCGKVKWILKA